jgi:hypothetical protein
LHRLLLDHRFALVSASELEQIPTEYRPLSTAAAMLHDSDELLPRLVDLTGLTPDHRAEFLNACVELTDALPPVTVLLYSDAEPPTLAAHLGRAQIAQSTNGERAWLRVHDPRVWFQLNRVLSIERLNALMGPVARLTFFFEGQWFTQKNTGPRDPATRFDAITWSALARIGVVNRVLAQAHPSEKTAGDVLRVSQLVDQLAERAIKHHHIARLDDQVEFCLMGLRVHARFDGHPRVRDVLTRVGQDPSAFDELLAQDEAFWQSISRALNMTGEANT